MRRGDATTALPRLIFVTTYQLIFRKTHYICEIKSEQKNQSNGGYLQQLCVMHGFSVKVMNKTIYVSELTALESLESEILIEKKHCMDWKISETDNNTAKE